MGSRIARLGETPPQLFITQRNSPRYCEVFTALPSTNELDKHYLAFSSTDGIDVPCTEKAIRKTARIDTSRYDQNVPRYRLGRVRDLKCHLGLGGEIRTDADDGVVA